MKLAETVTFGGSGLDRAAELRTDEARLKEEQAARGANAALLWRGKPLVSGEDTRALVRLPLDHPVIVGCTRPPVLIGREEGGVLFAYDLSDWEPEEAEDSTVGSFIDPSEQVHPDLPEGSRFAELRQVMTRISARDAEVAATAKSVLGWHQSHRFCSQCGAQSEMQQAGWQRVCPSCGAPHFPRTDPVVIMLVTHGNSVLLGRSPNWPEGMYSCLAGFVEPGETIEAAVRREVFEEAGVPVGRVTYLASQPWAFPSSLMFGCAAEALTRDLTLDPVEIEDARWATREEVMQAMAGESDWLKPARRGAIAQFMLQHWLSDTLD